MNESKVFNLILLAHSAWVKWGRSACTGVFVISLAAVSVAASLTGCGAAGEAVYFAAAPAGKETAQRADAPLIILRHKEGNFFVLASDIPFEVGKQDPDVSWMAVEKIKAAQTAHRVIAIHSKPEGLASGTYFSAVRVDLTTSLGKDHILIPVALQAGDAVAQDFSREQMLRSEVPENRMRLQVNDTNIAIRFMMTPGGHYVFEVIDIKKQQRKLQPTDDLK